jgi:hypothetical protein
MRHSHSLFSRLQAALLELFGGGQIMVKKMQREQDFWPPTPKEEACDLLDGVITSLERIWVRDEEFKVSEQMLANEIREELEPIFAQLCG